MIVIFPTTSFGHHILGLPHYAYDDQYPQTPVLTYRVDTGPFEVKMTGYPGRPQPGQRCSVSVYIKRLAGGEMFRDKVTFTAFRKGMFGQREIVYGPQVAELEESVFKFFPHFAEEADYLLRLEFAAEGAPWTIDLPMVVGEPGSPWKVVGGVATGVVVFLVVIRAIRIKRRRAERRQELARPVAA